MDKAARIPVERSSLEKQAKNAMAYPLCASESAECTVLLPSSSIRDCRYSSWIIRAEAMAKKNSPYNGIRYSDPLQEEASRQSRAPRLMARIDGRRPVTPKRRVSPLSR
jgi:hypothetical protein